MTHNRSLMEETLHLPEHAEHDLIYAGLVFVTDYQVDERLLCGRLIARSWDLAEERAEARGLNEVVVGKLVASIPYPEFGRNRPSDH